jgi:aspartyl-tRNA(Asn)/glutamyl-tRNA(Gln) amidotransferase subunit A
VRTRIAEDFSKRSKASLRHRQLPVRRIQLEADGIPLDVHVDYCTVPMPLAGIPAVSIPAGLAEPEGGGPELPVGFQIAGPAFSESGMLDAAYALERAIGFETRPPGLDGSSS